MNIIKMLILLTLLAFTTNNLVAEDLRNPKKQEERLNELIEFGDDAEVDMLVLMNVFKKSNKKNNKKIAKLSFKVIVNIGSNLDIAQASWIGLKSKDSELRTLYIEEFKKLDDKEISPIVIRMIKSKDSKLKELGIKTSAKIKAKATIKILVKLLLNKEETVSVYLNQLAASSLGKINDTEAIKPLIKALFFSKQKESLKKYAFNALLRFGNNALSEVTNTLNGENKDFNTFITTLNPKPNVNLTLIDLVAEFRNNTSLEVLNKYLSDKDLELRIKAQLAIGKIASKKSVKTLVKKYYRTKKTLLKRKRKDLKAKDDLRELKNINKAILMIGGKKANKHLVREMAVKSKKIKKRKKELYELRSYTLYLFSNIASSKYFKLYKKLLKKERNKRRKKTAILSFKLMSISKKCKSRVKCYISFIDMKKYKKTKRKFSVEVNNKKTEKTLNILERVKATYMLSIFTKGKSKKLALDAAFNKSLFDSDKQVREAGAFVISKLATKEDAKTMREVIKKAQKFKYLEEAEFLHKKILSRLVGLEK